MPDNAVAHADLGLALNDLAKLDEAIAEYRKALRLKPDQAGTHANLGVTLERQGKFEEAMASYRRANEVASPGSRIAKEMPILISRLEQHIALIKRLPPVLDGKDRPANPAECLAFALLCYSRKQFAAAARFWAAALVAEPKLADDRQAQHAYNAACMAALAAAGASMDKRPMDDDAKARLREQAQGWLKAELAAWASLLDADAVKARPVVVQTLEHWKVDPDLAAVRDPEPLSKLPAAEQESWRALWADVEALLTKAQRRAP